MLDPTSESLAAPGRKRPIWAVHSQIDVPKRRMGSTNWVKANRITMTATWLGTSTPSPTPSAAQMAMASTTRPASAQVSETSSCGSTPVAESTGAPRPIDASSPMTPNSAPNSRPTTSFAASTFQRRGVARNVGVMVWWRNSPVVARAPRSTGNTYPMAVVTL